MKKLFGTSVAVVGAVVVVYAGYALLGPGSKVMVGGWNPVYVGLAGLGVLTGGLLVRQE